jgi:hypothetical protein
MRQIQISLAGQIDEALNDGHDALAERVVRGARCDEARAALRECAGLCRQTFNGYRTRSNEWLLERQAGVPLPETWTRRREAQLETLSQLTTV